MRSPNHARGCVKTRLASFQAMKKGFKSLSRKIKTQHRSIVSVVIFVKLTLSDLSHSLAMQLTPKVFASRQATRRVTTFSDDQNTFTTFGARSRQPQLILVSLGSS